VAARRTGLQALPPRPGRQQTPSDFGRSAAAAVQLLESNDTWFAFTMGTAAFATCSWIEYQDTNRKPSRLIKLLGHGRPRPRAVPTTGASARCSSSATPKSIYSFGAVFSTILMGFRTTSAIGPATSHRTMVKLEENYRFHATILAAPRLIAHNQERNRQGAAARAKVELISPHRCATRSPKAEAVGAPDCGMLEGAHRA